MTEEIRWETGRPLAMRSQDDRGLAYTAAVERSEAAIAHVRQAVGDGRAVNTAAELATVAAALPPEASILLDPVMRIPEEATPGRDWTPSVVARIAMLAEQPATPVRDQRGREHDVLVAGVELSAWLQPPGPGLPGPAQGRALGPYDRVIEAIERDGPGDGLRAVTALLSHLAGLLTGDRGPASQLRPGGAADTGIATAALQLRRTATALGQLAPLADAEGTEDGE